MNIFNLPDLGEGLPDAEIHEWFVKEGDPVKIDQPIVSMETAKAVVDVPSPVDDIVSKLYGQAGDIIKTGDPLVAFANNEFDASKDKGTVVGHLEENQDLGKDNFSINTENQARVKATPAVRLLARKHNIDLATVNGTGEFGIITRDDIEKIANLKTSPTDFEPLRGVRRAMLHSMIKSHREVVPVSIYDEVDISAWPENSDITVRLIRALIDAAKKEPALNAWFDSAAEARKCFSEVNIGIAMDVEEGLFVPVIDNAAKYTNIDLRQLINRYKTELHARSLAPEVFKNATITLSNFGKFAGKFASPIIVPPTVAILAVGRLYNRTLPLSLSFDHRAVTGGEATRFLGAVIAALESPE